MDKAPDAFRIISEVAEDLDVPQHVLRFWESRFQQIKPMKRGGGRRYYRSDDVNLLRGIRHLLYSEGYTIRGVQRLLREHGIQFVQSVWREGAPQLPAGAFDEEVERAPRASLLGMLPGLLRESETREPGTAQAAIERREPTMDSKSPSAPRASAGGVGTDRPPDHEQVRQLEEVLRELRECRRLLDKAVEEEA